MTANTSIDPAVFLHEQLAQASPDLMRELLGTFINALLSAQADSVCGAEYGTRSRGPRQQPQRATGTGTSTPAPAPSTWRSRSCARGPSSRTGCSSGTAARRRR